MPRGVASTGRRGKTTATEKECEYANPVLLGSRRSEQTLDFAGRNVDVIQAGGCRQSGHRLDRADSRVDEASADRRSVESLAAALRVVLRATAMLAEHGGKQEQQQRTQKESVDKEQASSVHECEIT